MREVIIIYDAREVLCVCASWLRAHMYVFDRMREEAQRPMTWEEVTAKVRWTWVNKNGTKLFMHATVREVLE